MPKLIGRDDLLRRVLRLLAQSSTRFVTLTGPGGVGKTRLAREILARAQPATFVDLSALRDPAEVVPAIARAEGVRGDSGEPLLQRLLQHLRQTSPLLVLDNFEALLPAASDISGLLEGCPGVRVLATSRIALRIPLERVIDVPPLDLDSAAVALYVERAQAIRPDFELDDANSSAVLDICRRLDGLPLAIELAAARVRVLPPRALVTRLDRVYDIVASDLPELPDRQRGLRRLVDWSYQLLDDSTRRCYVRAAVFDGGFDLEALAAVTDTATLPRLLEAVDTLTQANLIRQADLETPEARFRMLETIREQRSNASRASPTETQRKRQRARANGMRTTSCGLPKRPSPI